MKVPTKLLILTLGLILLNACNNSTNDQDKEKKKTSKENNHGTNTSNQVERLDYEIIEVTDEEGNLVYNEDGTIKRDTIFYAKRPEIDTSKYAIFSVFDVDSEKESFIIHNKVKTDTRLINTPCECAESLTELLDNILKPTTNDPNLSSPKEMVQAYHHHYDYIQNHCKNKLGFQKNDWKDCENSQNLSEMTDEFKQILKSEQYLVSKVDGNGNVVFAEDGSVVKDTVVFDI